jgi:hypothetical protein
VSHRRETELARILTALRADESPLRRSGVAMIVDFTLARPLRDFIDRDGLVAIFTRSLDVESVVRVLRDRGRKAWARQTRRARDARLPIGAALPEAVRDRLRGIIAATKPPTAGWARNAVDPVLVRKLVAPALQDVLLAFTRRLPLSGLSGAEPSWPGLGLVAEIGARVREEIEKRAGQVADAGRAVLDGLGIDVERQIETLTRDFSQTAERDLREALTKRIDTPEGRALLGEIQTQVFDRLLSTRLDELRADLETVPWADLAELIGPAIHHLRSQPFFERALGEEIDAWLAADGARPIAELLREIGLFDAVREHALTRGEDLGRALFTSDEFARWLAELLTSEIPD